jgi:hypothetical protein
LVVFSGEAKKDIEVRWSGTSGALTPVQLPPNEAYLPNLIKSVKNPVNSLFFKAVGYGSGEITESARLFNINFDPFLIRYIANNLSYNANNPVNDILRLSQNTAKGENGTCRGDSGGPIFYEDENLGRIQVSLTSGGDAACRATSTGPGFSRPEAFDFVNCGIEKKVVGEGREDREVEDVVECVAGLGL